MGGVGRNAGIVTKRRANAGGQGQFAGQGYFPRWLVRTEKVRGSSSSPPALAGGRYRLKTLCWVSMCSRMDPSASTAPHFSHGIRLMVPSTAVPSILFEYVSREKQPLVLPGRKVMASVLVVLVMKLTLSNRTASLLMHSWRKTGLCEAMISSSM